ncbi:MAG: hypothetical protein K9M11_04830 [Candidatus Pacebacteria bacterium]|nr:hypothetical protein [Candidatus Paceibacterota bacterium]
MNLSVHTSLSYEKGVTTNNTLISQPHSTMPKVYKITFWTIVILLGLLFILKIQKVHYEGSGTYAPRPAAVSSRYEMVRVDNTKPNVGKLQWATATTATGGKWTIAIDTEAKQEFNTIEDLNRVVSGFGLVLRPRLTLWERICLGGEKVYTWIEDCF